MVVAGVILGMGLGLLLAYRQLIKTIKPKSYFAYMDYADKHPHIYRSKQVKKGAEPDPVMNPVIKSNGKK